MLTYQHIKNTIEDPTHTVRGIDIFNSFGNKIQIDTTEVLKKKGKIFYAKDLDKLLSEVFASGNGKFDHLKIRFYKSNGSTWKEPQELIIYPDDIMQHATHQQQPAQSIQQPYQSANQPTNPFAEAIAIMTGGVGMNGGMNAPQMIYRMQDYPKLEKKLEETKSELKTCNENNRKLEKQVADLKLDLKLIDIKANSKSFWDSPLFDTIKEMAPSIVEKAIEQYGQAATGMNAPLPPLNRQVKQQLCNAVREMDDDSIAYILQIINLLINNQDFNNDLTNLLQTYTDEPAAN